MLAFAFLLSAIGCASGPQLDATIHESARGRVYLERISTSGFLATYPIRLAPKLIARSLQGVVVREGNDLLQSFSANQRPTISAFTQDDIAFLAPAIEEGLSQAAAEQQIGFGWCGPGKRTLGSAQELVAARQTRPCSVHRHDDSK